MIHEIITSRSTLLSLTVEIYNIIRSILMNDLQTKDTYVMHVAN